MPPEPLVGENARSLYRFALPTETSPNCELESARLRLFNDSPETGRTVDVVPLAAPWRESSLTWLNQPATTGSPISSPVLSSEGYQEWNVLPHVEGMIESGINHGWQVRDAHENDPEGAEQNFVSRESPQDPPPATLPHLILRYEADTAPPPPPPTPATTPREVECGEVLRQSTLVANDLRGCPGEGLVVGAPNIVVDLGGHTIHPPAVFVDPGEEDGLLAGVRNSGHSNVVIRNGTVKGYGYGILLTGGTTRNVIEDMKLESNLLGGIELNDADDGRNGNTIRDNELTSNGESAISLINGSENSVITGNLLHGNGGVGFQLIEADGHRFENNTMSGVPLSALVDSDSGANLEHSSDNVFRNNTFHDFGDAGFVITLGSHRNLVQDNEIVRSGDAGVYVQDSDDNRVIGNVAHQSSDGGIVVSNGNGTVLRGNDVRFNPNGVDVGNSNNVLVEDNDASDSLQSAIEVGNGLNLRILDNTANSSGGAGISMEGGAFDVNGSPIGGALIEGNTANENAETGIAVADGGHEVADNNAHNNAGYGISIGENPEVPGEPFAHTNIDGGNNRASGNAEVDQCSGLICITTGSVPLLPVDLTGPQTIIDSGPAVVTPNQSATFTFHSQDNINPQTGEPFTPETAMVYECRLDPPPDPLPEPPDPETEPPHPNEPPDTNSPPDPGNWVECASPMRYAHVEEGVHHFEVRALDQADNVDLTPATHDWEVDITIEDDALGPDAMPPSVRIAAAPPTVSSVDSATFRFAGSDNLTPGLRLRFECRLDSTNDADWAPCSTPKDYGNLANGTHTFQVRSIDLADNRSAPASHTWEVDVAPTDATAPETTLDPGGPDPITVRTNATFTFSSNDATALFECSLDGGGWASCASPKFYPDLPVGAHAFRVRAVDPSGNVDESPPFHSWTISSAPVPTTAFCGKRITQSIKLLNDLGDCLWDGLVVAADGITIDLNGHRIDGTGVAAGIRNDGFDSVTVTNGTIVEFDYGVALNAGTTSNIVDSVTVQTTQEGGMVLGLPPWQNNPTDPAPAPPPPTFKSNVSGNTLRNNSIFANDQGLWLTNETKDTVISGNAIAGNSNEGIWIERSSGNRVVDNDVERSSKHGIAIQGSNGNTVVDNRVLENGGGILVGATDAGATVGLPSHDNVIERNTLDETSGNAIELTGVQAAPVTGNQVIDNVAHRSNGTGIELYHANESLLRGNDVRTNKTGIVLANSSENRLEYNDASESGANGIEIANLSHNNVLLRNTSGNNDGVGIYVGDEVGAGSGTVIERNNTSNNKGYGIHVPKVSHTITGNTANDNGTWGIWASEGSNNRVNVDGGGNKAQGNLGPLNPLDLKPLQCFSVRCDGSAGTTDRIPPTTQLLEGPPATTRDDVATFRFSGHDNASSVAFACRLDSDSELDWEPCESPYSFIVPFESPPGLNQHTLEVRAIDASGNPDPTPAVHEWEILPPLPFRPPLTTIHTGPDHSTVRTDALFEFSADERLSTFSCSLDGNAFAPCSWVTMPTIMFARGTARYAALSPGVHTFDVRAADADVPPNVGSPAHWSWVVEAPPAPAEVACGEILVESVRVTNDLIDCPGNGIIVGTGGITIDLDGHTIDGVGLDAGILNHGFDNVTITNGTLTEFDYGVQLNPGSGRNVISMLRTEFNQEAGIALADADQNGHGNTVRGNTVVHNKVGIALYSNTRNTVVRDNSLGANSAEGVLIEHSTGNRVEHNEIAGSSGAAVAMWGGGDNIVADNELSNSLGAGVMVGEEMLPSNNSRVERNTIEGAGGGGVSVIDSSGVVVAENVIRNANGTGVALDLARNAVVRANDVRGNAGGIVVDESRDNTIELNNASGGTGSGIEVGALSPNNDVLRNIANDNGGEGIQIEDSALIGQGTIVEGNEASGNGGDGIGLEGVGHIVKDNTANMNGGWGIYAAVGAIDRGGNKAGGNAEFDQCFGVVCNFVEIPGAPETWIVDKPANPSNSRNASFTYMGSDAETPIHELVFECRIDSDDPFAWEDCDYPAEIRNLSPGPHTFEVRTIDALGAGLADPTPARYTWNYVPLPSGVAPQAFIDVKPPEQSFLLDAIFTFHSNEPDVTFECKVDLFPYEPCGFEMVMNMNRGGFEWSFAETEVGPHTFSVRAIDFEGNVGTPATYTFNLLGVTSVFLPGPNPASTGFTPPENPLELATGGETLSTTAVVDFESNMADATFECSLDLEPFVPCTPPVTYTGLLPGEHLLRVIATDAQGNESLEPAEYEWEVVDPIDTGPPETSIELAPPNNSSATKFEFVGTDDLTPPHLITFECRIDSNNALDWEGCESPFNLLERYTYEDPQLAPGQHTFEVRAIDDAEPVDPTDPNFEGNVDPTPATYTWTMTADTTPPTTGIVTEPPARIGTETPADFEFLGTDNATPDLMLTFECSVDTAPFEPCSSPESFQGLLPGEHTIRIRSVDVAGNVDTTPATRTLTVVPLPVTTITSGPSGRVLEGVPFTPPTQSENAIFVFSADQPGSTFECSLDGADFRRCTSPQAYWVVDNGQHEFEVRATNPEGVVEEPPASYIWNVELGPDVTGPSTTITSGPPAVTPSSIATFEFNGSDNRTAPENLTFECALDGTAYNSCTSPDQWSDLTRGNHTLLVRARDAAGNFDPTPASYTWLVELPPVTTILTGPAEITGSTAATFTFASDVPGSTFICWMDGVLVDPCSSPKTYTGLSHGPKTFFVLARAPGGTWEEQWVEYEWTIGHTRAPITTITLGPDIESENPRATFEFSADQTGVLFECSVDGGEPRPCNSPFTIARTGLGEHTFEVTATHPIMLDPFGEQLELLYEPITASYEWTYVDRTPPEAVIRYGPPSTTSSLNAHFGFTSSDPTAIVECSLDFEGFSECASPHVFEDLLPGDHVVHVRAVDEAGNLSPTLSYRWTIEHPTANTPAGNNVTVSLPMPNPPGGNATVNFFEVSLAGATTLDALHGGPPLPPGYSLAGSRYFDISTTAEYGEPIRLCVPYVPGAVQSARLLQWDGSTFVDVTLTNNPETGVVCGEELELSTLFAVADGSGTGPIASIISGPPLIAETGTATFEFVVDQPDVQAQCSLDGLPWEECTSPKTYTKLETGSHTFQVQALGPFGLPSPIPPTPYEWEVVLPPDTTPPDTRIVKAPPSLTANWEVGFEFTGTDDQTQDLELDFECLLDGVLLGSCSSVLSTPTVAGVPYLVEVLAAGEHTFEVRAIDETLNVDPTPAKRVFTVVDLAAPETSIDLGPQEETTATTAMFTFTGEVELTGQPVFDFQCSLDGADFTPCTSPHSVEGMTVGPHSLQVRAVGANGAVDITPEIYEWLVLEGNDTTPPDTFIVHTPQPTSGPDVIFGFQSNEPVEEYECRLDNEPFQSCGAVLELQGLTPGDHTLRVRAIDMAVTPNVDPTPASFTWSVVGEPETTILTHPAALSGSKSATFTFTSDQPGVTFKCSVDGSIFVPCTSPYVAGPLIQDTHTFEVYAQNRFRYLDGTPVIDQTPAEFEWEVQDVEPPDTTILSVVFLGLTDLVEPNSLRFELAGTDNGTVAWELEFECSLDGGPWEGCDIPFHYLPLEDLTGGNHELRVRAVDDFDNVDPTPAVHTFTTEAAPETTILSGPPAESGATEATFTFSADLPGATFECSLDLGPFVPCTSGQTFTGIPHGLHEMHVRARSAGGSAVEQTPAEYAFETGDMTPPIVTIHSGPAIATTDTTATFTFSDNDPEAQLQCSLDGAPLSFCASPLTFTQEQLAVATGHWAGPHTLEVTATKQHLLAETVPAVWEWTIEDHTAPATTIVSTPLAEIPLGTAAAFRFSSSEPNSTFECSLDPDPVPQYTACGGPPDGTAEFTGLEAGQHTLLVRAVDPSLNADGTPESFSFTVVGPAVTTITGNVPADPAETSETSAEFTFSADQPGVTFTCSLDGADFVPCPSPVTVTNMSFGGHTFEVQSTNRFGLVEEPPAIFEWNVGLPPGAVAPETTIETGPEPLSLSTTATFGFFADQVGSTFQCSLDSGPFLDCAAPVTYTSLSEGVHTFAVRATSVEGYPEAEAAVYEWNVDLAPETTIDTKPPSLTLNTTAVFNFSSNEPSATFECSLDQPVPSFGSCPHSVTFANLPAGTHELQVRAVDSSSTPDPTPVVYRWTIGPAPETTILSAPEEATESTSATFTFQSSVAGATFQCALDEAAENLFFTPCASGVTYNDLSLGDHDPAGPRRRRRRQRRPDARPSGSGPSAASRRPSRSSPRPT